MIDLSGFPPSKDAPELGSCVRIERPEPGLAVVVLDPPHRSLAVLDLPLIRDLDHAIDELEGDSTLKGIVITGREPNQFAAGADIDAIESITDPALVRKLVLVVHGLFRRIEKLSARTVAAVGGPVPGGAFELSLSCDRIVATDHPKTRIGLPETLLGILPGWGGSHRLPKRVGVPGALGAILTGRLYPARKALKAGFIDRMTKPEYLLRVATEIAMGRMKCPRRERGWKALLVDRNPLALMLIERQARRQVMSKTRGKYPAPLAALELVLKAPTTSIEQGANKEADAVADLASGPICKNLIAIFKSSEAAKRLGRPSETVQPRKLERGGVIGAGIMGGAIASLMAEKGLAVRLSDLSEEALDAALHQHRADVAKKQKRRRYQRHEAEGALDRLDTTSQSIGFGRTQIVIEAVAERLDVKQKVFHHLAQQMEPDAILATNTSSLSVDAIAENLPNPERIVGMHFFNPVKKMPLVEIVRGSQTSEEVVRSIAALSVKLGKTPVVVKDCAGFLVNRILGPYLDEAVRLFIGGADVRKLDELMLDFGMPMGPFTLLDEVGLDIAAHAAESLHAAYGDRMMPSPGIGDLMSPDRLGKKTGRGFYDHPKGPGKKKDKAFPADDLARFQREEFATLLSDEQLVERMVLAMVNEAARCMEESVAANPAEFDLATVFGTGFAPFHGGVLRYADSIGLDVIVQKLETIAQSPDMRLRNGGPEKFEPAKILRELAAAKRGFHDATLDNTTQSGDAAA